jgi:CHAT domain-containing protein
MLVEEHAFAEALELAERSKARVLTQLLRGDRGAEDATLTVEEKRELTRRRDALYSLNRQAEKAPQSESLRRAARDDLAAFEASLAAQHPEMARRRGQVRPLALADINRILTDRKTAIVEYVVAGQQLFVFTVANDGPRVTVSARPISIGASEIASRIGRFRERIAKRDFSVNEDARPLYDALLAPVSQSLSRRARLIVVPDGPLWNLPFQALRTNHGYLIEDMAVSYAPSITALREILQLRGPVQPRRLLAFGKTEFDPAPAQALQPLPEAGAQVRLITELYGRDRSAAYLDGEASESRFKAAAPLYTILHLATHGMLDEASPLYSYLVLSRDPHNARDDGRLEAWEIMHMKLTAELVVLAACETGRGRIAPGEGLIGAMWAFFAAGARAIVVSQFRVESKSADTLLVAFHRRLAAGSGSKAVELRAAAIELLHTPRYAHPYYWAGFILAGDSD